MAADPLSDLLKTVRLTGAAFFDITAQAPWAIDSPAPAQILPKLLPGADHLMAYHVVTAGTCFAAVGADAPIALEAGDVIVLTRSQAHVMCSDPGLPADPMMPDVLEIAAAGERPYSVRCGDGPASTRLVCGYLACDARPFNPLLGSLPPVITARDQRNDGAGWIGQLIRFAVSEAAERHAGGDSVLTRLSELMFIDVVRRYLETLPAEQAGWLGSLRDAAIAKALSLMHSSPAHCWTIDELAREAGVSRSVLAERFAARVGLPPMHYLAKWRMQLAAQMLAGSDARIATIAASIGYDSEAAFSRAFKKMIGVSPSDWRKGGRAQAGEEVTPVG